MRIGQVIDEIFKDKSKVYEAIDDDGFKHILKYQLEYRRIIMTGPFDYKYDSPLQDDFQELNWELVPKVVTFMEAVESGKEFRPEAWKKGSEMELSDLLYDLSENSSEHIRELLLGKFYIKEDN